MRKFSNTRLSRLAALLTAGSLAIVGCGGGSSSSSSQKTTSQESTVAAKANLDKNFKGPPRIVKFGKEASPAERDAASEVLEANLKAREEGDFAGQCATASLVSKREVTGLELPIAVAKKCPAELEKLAQPLKATEAARKNTMAGPVAVLRVKGSNGIALYHGNDGHDYAIPLEKENGEWKVRSLISPRLN